MIIETEQRIKALAKFLSVHENQIEVSDSDSEDWLLEYADDEYLVLTDDEADDEYAERLGNYFEDCILIQIPDELQIYFDEKFWLKDAQINTSRGSELANYDGKEETETVNDVDFYIYRQC